MVRKKKNMSIVMLQEAHCTTEAEKQWYVEWGYNIYFSHEQTDARGVCILFNNNFEYKIHNVITDDHGRYIILDITAYQQRFTLTNVYGPNEDKPEFFEIFIHNVESIPNDHRIIGGDFNFVLNCDIDKKGGQDTTHLKN